jgi:DDE family transposase
MIPASLSGVGDPVVARWQAFFAPVDWTAVDQVRWRRPGPTPHPPSAYGKALLIKVHERLGSVARLRAYLLEHPALVLALGFRPVLDPAQPGGVDIARTVPGERWLRHQQQHLDPACVDRALAATVAALRRVHPKLGQTVAIDTTHIYAYVRENNPKESMPHRFAPAHRPRGDHDCALGVKARANQTGAGRSGKTYLFGYGCGLAAAPVPGGEAVLATYVQPFNRQDITYFRPLYEHVTSTLGHPPVHLTADAAFDAWQVYEAVTITGGIAAVAANRRGPTPPRSPEGHPLCAQEQPMRPTRQGRHEDGYRVQHYGCPLRGSDASCTHPQFARGGCRKRINIEAGGRLRATMDRTDPTYLAIYRQRTSVERIYSQAKALGLEHPIVRTQAAVERLAALIAITINLRLIARTPRCQP